MALAWKFGRPIRRTCRCCISTRISRQKRWSDASVSKCSTSFIRAAALGNKHALGVDALAHMFESLGQTCLREGIGARDHLIELQPLLLVERKQHGKIDRRPALSVQRGHVEF